MSSIANTSGSSSFFTPLGGGADDDGGTTFFSFAACLGFSSTSSSLSSSSSLCSCLTTFAYSELKAGPRRTFLRLLVFPSFPLTYSMMFSSRSSRSLGRRVEVESSSSSTSAFGRITIGGELYRSSLPLFSTSNTKKERYGLKVSSDLACLSLCVMRWLTTPFASLVFTVIVSGCFSSSSVPAAFVFFFFSISCLSFSCCSSISFFTLSMRA
mmetsp:Transcript_9340/g.25377  ORF Transcript_9340/g.25377 Transcript_9340/m.25377 type:complete len:212 (+) Transcript_9340:781-1416(+)